MGEGDFISLPVTKRGGSEAKLLRQRQVVAEGIGSLFASLHKGSNLTLGGGSPPSTRWPGGQGRKDAVPIAGHGRMELKLMEMTSEADRLSSFSDVKWPFTSGMLAPKNMAESGFYYCGSEEAGWDSVRCFVCLKVLGGWEPEDDPWMEHKNHSRACLMAKLGKKQSLMTVYEVYDVMAAHCIAVQEETLKVWRGALEEMRKQVVDLIIAKNKKAK